MIYFHHIDMSCFKNWVSYEMFVLVLNMFVQMLVLLLTIWTIDEDYGDGAVKHGDGDGDSQRLVEARNEAQVLDDQQEQGMACRLEPEPNCKMKLSLETFRRHASLDMTLLKSALIFSSQFPIIRVVF